MVAQEAQAQTERAYMRAMLRELDLIVANIPADRLAIQWDAPLEFAILEGVMPSFLTNQPNAEDELVGRLLRLGNSVPQNVELGYHL